MVKVSKLIKSMVFVISILCIFLITTHLEDYLINYKNNYNPLWFTLGGMAVIVVVFIPLYNYLDQIVLRLSSKLMRSGKKISGSEFGIFIVFIIIMIILFYFYAKLWYDIDAFKIMFTKLKSLF